MTDAMQSTKPVELSSIINVVQHDSQCGPKHQRKMELKSVVCLGPTAMKKDAEVKGHDPKSPSKVSKVSPEKPVLLLPFGHQVSGRASILCYDETTLLKPYVSRELFFYQTIPQDLKKFTPQFRGLVMVSFIEDSRTASVLAYALPRTLVKPNTKNITKLFDEEPKPHSKRCVKDYGKTHVIYPSTPSKAIYNSNEENENLFVDSGENFSPVISQVHKDEDVVSELSEGFDVTVCIEDKKASSGKENEENRISTTGLHNPWNSKVLDDAWLKLKFSNTDNPANGKKKRFTLLENAVARYRRPCVLDLKIGTRVRQDASPEKIARHVTAINLGARLSGMQVYHPEQEQFTYHNKYYGHNLTVSGFKSNLRHFFSRGAIPIKGSKSATKQKNSSVDKKLVEQAIMKLKELRDTIESMQSHRFYSSSVLFLYEGDVSRKQDEKADDTNDEETTVVISDKRSSPKPVPRMSEHKMASRSFSFSELMQKWKHTRTRHAQLSLDRHDFDSKHRSGSHKREKSHKNDDQKSPHKIHRELEDDDFHEQKFESRSWPPRSQSAKRSHSQKILQERDKSAENHQKERRKNTEKTQHHGDHGKSAKRHSRKTDDKIGSGKSRKDKIHDTEKHHHHHKEKSSIKEQPHKKQAHKNHGDLDPSHNDHVSIKEQLHKKHAHKNHSDLDPSQHDHEKEQPHKKHAHKNHDDLEQIHHDHESKFTREDLKRKHSDASTHDSDVIEVKMIDFAHYCFHDNEMHPGPDGGFIYGLNCVVELLNEMLEIEQ